MTATLNLLLSDLLPDVDEAHDACVVRLVGTLESHDGVAHVHVVTGHGATPTRLCVHHDPAVLPAEQARALVDTLSDGLRSHFGHVRWRASRPGQACAAAERLRHVSGVRAVETTAEGLLHVEFNRDRTSEVAVRAVLDEVTGSDDAQPEVPHA